MAKETQIIKETRTDSFEGYTDLKKYSADNGVSYQSALRVVKETDLDVARLGGCVFVNESDLKKNIYSKLIESETKRRRAIKARKEVTIIRRKIEQYFEVVSQKSVNGILDPLEIDRLLAEHQKRQEQEKQKADDLNNRIFNSDAYSPEQKQTIKEILKIKTSGDGTNP